MTQLYIALVSFENLFVQEAMRYLIIIIVLSFTTFIPEVHAERYRLPSNGGSIIGQLGIISTQEDDTFIKLARRFQLGYQELVIANPNIDPWLPGEGTQVVIPTRYILPDAKREGMVLNLAEMRLYYYPGKKSSEANYVYTYPISIGRGGWDTPHTLTKIIAKSKNPTWYPPESIRKEHEEKNDPLPVSVPPGPDNPLGDYALRLALPGYLIHGTNEPRGIGMKVTHGCIRLHPNDIESLFSRVSIDTPVAIVNQPYKLAWHEGSLYAEMHPNEGDETGTNSRYLTEFVRAIIAATKINKDYKVNWKLANRLAKNKSGLPVVVGAN